MSYDSYNGTTPEAAGYPISREDLDGEMVSNLQKCKLSFDTQFTFADLNLPSNVVPVVSIILPYLTEYNDIDLTHKLISYVSLYSNDGNFVFKIIELIEKFLTKNIKISPENRQLIYKHMINHDNETVTLIGSNDKPYRQNIFDEIHEWLILSDDLDKDCFIYEFKNLFKNKKIIFKNKISDYIINNSTIKLNDWKILYSTILYKCFMCIGHVSIRSQDSENFTTEFDVGLFVQMLSILSGIDKTIVMKYISEYNNLDSEFMPYESNKKCLLQFMYNSISNGVENIINYSNALKSKLEYNQDNIFADSISYVFQNIKIDNIKTYDLHTFDVSKYNIDCMCNLLKQKKCNILIYGPPGIGKTEFVKAILYKIHKDYLNYCHTEVETVRANGRNSSSSDDAFMLFFNRIQNYASSHNKAIVIDECDALINVLGFYNEKTLKKSQLNELLDRSITNNIWITNYITSISESSLRRFDLVIKFNDLSNKQKNKIWKNILTDHDIKYKISNKEIETFIKKYNKLTPSNINNIIKNAKLNNISKNKTNFIYNINKEASNIYNNIFGIEITENKENNKNKPVNQYLLNTININYNPNDIIKTIGEYIKNSNPSCAMSLLFTGMPGTGKTEFAKYIAKAVKKELYIQRYSDISNSYVGETEKQIAAAFKKAEKENKILLLDECDSIFQTRDNAVRSWEITQTNEFLTQLENYRGIIICTTNFLKNLDDASMRRFRYKITFNPLKYDDRLLVYKKYFNKKEIPENIKHELYKMDNLCFGDIKIVYERLSMLSKNFKHNEVIKELKHELSFKKSNNEPIGFY